MATNRENVSGQRTLFDNRIYNRITRILFPLFLFALAFLRINKGTDITDVGYNLGNYVFLKGLDRMWYYSTFLANIIGHLITKLPGGACMLGFSVYACIIKASLALISYFFLACNVKIKREAAFAGSLISLALCWGPQVCLYHYLSYYVFALGAIFIYRGLVSHSENNLYIAGIILALGILVRFPNLCQAALIVAVWFYSIITRDSFKAALRKTLKCMAGYLGTVLLTVSVLVLDGHMAVYINAIKDLFAMTGESERYGVAFTVLNLVNSYTCIWYWLIPLVLAFVALAVLGLLPIKARWFGIVSEAAAVGGMAVVYVWFYKTELFDYDFTSYSSMYLFGVVMLVICLFLFAWAILNPALEKRIRLMAMSALIIQFVTPFGTNNSLYVVLNSLFLIMPVALELLGILRGYRATKYVHTSFMALFVLFTIQMCIFSSIFTFREKQVEKQDTAVKGVEVVKGMKTTASTATLLEELDALWNEKNLSNGYVLTFGDVPGIAYYMGTEPALSSTWPSLDSYSVEKFAGEMESLRQKDKPVTVVTDRTLEDSGEKQDILKEFLVEFGYTMVYDKQGIIVWLQEE